MGLVTRRIPHIISAASARLQGWIHGHFGNQDVK
jgi:hypothetical protein